VEQQRIIDHSLSCLSATTVSDDAPTRNGVKSKPRQRGDWD